MFHGILQYSDCRADVTDGGSVRRGGNEAIRFVDYRNVHPVRRPKNVAKRRRRGFYIFFFFCVHHGASEHLLCTRAAPSHILNSRFDRALNTIKSVFFSFFRPVFHYLPRPGNAKEKITFSYRPWVLRSSPYAAGWGIWVSNIPGNFHEYFIIIDTFSRMPCKVHFGLWFELVFNHFFFFLHHLYVWKH